MFIDRMPAGFRVAMDILQHGIAALTSGFITTRVYANFIKSTKFMQLKEGIDLPIWPANLAVVISFGFLTLVFLLLFAKAIFIGDSASNELEINS
jgi:TRAP-type C4-dicarboxylate transport system permease small subunit